MNARRLKALSLFSGAGGMDIGVTQAGFDILACIEIDPYACETLQANIDRERRSTEVIKADIRSIEPEALLLKYKLRPGDLDLLFGGPPCQTFSQIGKKSGLDDDRGKLLFEVVRFARVFMPRSILVEQVKGLLNAVDDRGRKGGVLMQLYQQLQEIGYQVTHKVINAADYGVPQLRERIFIVGMRGIKDFRFPQPTHAPPEKITLFYPLKPYISVGEALSGLGKPLQKNDGYVPEDSHLDVTPEGDRYRINGVPEGSHLAAQTHLPCEQRRNLTKKDTTKFKRLSREEPSNTLRCGEIFFHPNENRYLTPREYMRLHGYPDEYILRGPIRGRSGQARYLDQHRQVANSVPPPVAYALAKSIKEALDAESF